MKKMLFMIAIISALWLVSPTAGVAVEWVQNCTVNSVGAGADTLNNYVPIQMTCPGYPLKNFYIMGGDMAAKNRVLATFLTAISTERVVMIRVDDMNATQVGVDVVLVRQ